MEKLELKNIAGYLPYGLKVKTGNGKLIRTLNIEIDENSRDIISLNNIITGIGHKPILHPLSDLTKEIEVNGENFLPIEELSHYAIQQTDNGINGLEWNIVSTFPYRDIQKLYEWHFDVHDLIGKGLAIDINTIENGIQ